MVLDFNKEIKIPNFNNTFQILKLKVRINDSDGVLLCHCGLTPNSHETTQRTAPVRSKNSPEHAYEVPDPFGEGRKFSKIGRYFFEKLPF